MKAIKTIKVNKLLYFTLLLLLIFTTACGEEHLSEGSCSVNEDCSDSKVCDNNLCVVKEAKPFEVTGELYEIGNPTNRETLSLELINRARANPTLEGEFLNATGNNDVVGAISFFKINMDLVVAAFKEYEVRPPIAFNKQLNQAALRTSSLMKEHDVQAHTINGIPFDQRINESGYSWTNIGENIFAYAKSMVQGHAGFNIDWGEGPNGIQNPPGHRNTIMGTKTVFKEVGISVLTNIPSSLKVGPMIIAQDFGIPQGNKNFITGVVYDDLNANKFYDLGEGIGGVTISTENGAYKAVTTDSGAYTLPIDKIGDTRAQASGENFPNQIQNITLKYQNYKLDFNIQKNAANGDASIGFGLVKFIIKAVFEDAETKVYQQAPTNVTLSK